VDILNNTPLLDIKSYIHTLGSVADSTSGWMTATPEDIAQKRSDTRFTYTQL